MAYGKRQRLYGYYTAEAKKGTDNPPPPGPSGHDLPPGSEPGLHEYGDLSGKPALRKGRMRAFLRAQTPTLRAGYDTLAQIIAAQGRTDPRLLARETAAIDRGTEQTRADITAQGAEAGLAESGLLRALDTAAAQSGTEMIAGAEAREASRAEERKRQDLQLLLDLVIGPRFQRRALNLQKRAADKRNAGAGFNYGQGASGLADILKALGGGGGKDSNKNYTPGTGAGNVGQDPGYM